MSSPILTIRSCIRGHSSHLSSSTRVYIHTISPTHPRFDMRTRSSSSSRPVGKFAESSLCGADMSCCMTSSWPPLSDSDRLLCNLDDHKIESLAENSLVFRLSSYLLTSLDLQSTTVNIDSQSSFQNRRTKLSRALVGIMVMSPEAVTFEVLRLNLRFLSYLCGARPLCGKHSHTTTTVKTPTCLPRSAPGILPLSERLPLCF